jgi:hypothetical protein
MKSFIATIIEDVLKNHKNIDQLKFVLPSQRSCVFLKEELLNKLPSTTFFPKIESIENYIQELADIHLIDNTQLLFEFYSIYKEHIPLENREPFESFSQWATTALHDFNELDSYLVNPEDFFSNLRDIKKLNKWFQDKKPSKLATNYLQFFEYLHEMYQSLYEKLKSDKYGYQGLVYREATENLEFYIHNEEKIHTIFIGFNALNRAEETIFQELLNNNLATVYWDASEAVLNPSNEAGFFLRKYKKEWTYYQKNDFLWSNLEKETEQEIQIIGAPKNTTQIKFAGELLANFQNFNKTALVLADENLLSLTLNSLPSNVQNINITMGYPLKDIPIASLFDQLFKLHLNQLKFNKKEAGEFYFKDILNVLNDPFLNKLYKESLQKISSAIKKSNRIFLTVEDLKNMISVEDAETLFVLFSLFNFSENCNEIIKQCGELIHQLKDFVEGVEKEYLFRFFKVFQQLELLNTKYNHITDLKTLTVFYNQILQNEKLSFQGEPLQGLQLMGMLETRVLDFDTVIITSVNEGILPGGKNDHSFIPFDVKKHFGLPTYQEKDAIFSYHFQRLLQRAKKVYLIYNTETDGYGSGEKSRFLTKLEIQNPTILKNTVSPIVQQIEVPLIEIKKTTEVLEKLKEVCTYGISPSALATYIYNPIQFYEQKILKIKENEEVEETIAANTMGTVIHEVLYQMYLPFEGKFINSATIDAFLKQLDALLIHNFKIVYKKGAIKSGKNKLIFEVCKNYIQRFLKLEKAELQKGSELKIIALEQKLETIITIEGIDFPIKIKGTVDRIDALNGTTRIIDYKTGKVVSSNLKLSDFSLIAEDYKYTKPMQVLLYAYLYTKENNYNFAMPLEAGIISFKNLNSGFLKMNFSEQFRGMDSLVSEEKLNEFIIEIKQLIKEILDPNKSFIQNENLPF